MKPQQISGHDSSEIVSEVKKTREIKATHRVYRKEWLFDSRHGTEDGAKLFASTQYAGRLYDDDIKFEAESGGGVVLWTRRWNVAGEWKWEELAVQHAEKLKAEGAEVEVVARNSKQEHRLRNYGVLKLVES